MTNEQMTMQLLAIRASVDAMLSLLAPDQPPQLEEDGECKHPPEARQNLDTMGVERWQCKVCGYLFERKLEGGE